MEFTTEQLAEIQRQIDEAVKRATASMYSQDELDRQVQREVDRRVESGIQTAIKNQREKLKKEIEDEMNLSADELAQRKLDEKMAEIKEKEAEIATRTNRVNAIEKLTSEKVPKTYYEKLLGNLISPDGEATMSNIDAMIEVYSSTKKSLEEQIRSELANINPPAGGGGGSKAITKEDFDAMPFNKKVEFKQTNPEEFAKFIK